MPKESLPKKELRPNTALEDLMKGILKSMKVDVASAIKRLDYELEAENNLRGLIKEGKNFGFALSDLEVPQKIRNRLKL